MEIACRISHIILASFLLSWSCKSYAIQNITAIYAFGDSYTDTGNALVSNPAVYGSIIGNLPYGETFFGSPTGRCSDGRLVIDFMTKAAGQGFLPPYLKVGHLPLKDRAKGVNFAVAGATATDSVELLLKHQVPSLTPLSLGKQVEWFMRLKASSECNRILNSGITCGDFHFTNALYVIGEIGVNDYLGALFSKRQVNFIQMLVPQVIGKVINAIEILTMEISAPKYLIVQGMPAFGCFPSVLYAVNASSASDYDNNGCLTEVNKVAMSHNTMLRSYLKDLQQRFPGIRIEFQDYYDFFTREVSSNPLGLKACCGRGGGPYNFDIRGLCGTKSIIPMVNKQFTTCKDPSTFFSWDGIHLTDAASWDGIHLTDAANREAFDYFSSSSL